jgi:hypothetical protein
MCVCAVAACCQVTPQLLGAPLDLQQVPADAKAVGHLDFDTMRDTVFVKKLRARHEQELKQADGPMKVCEILTGLNPKTDLHGLTFFSKQIGKRQGVAILHAKLDQKKISAWAEKLPGRQVSEHNGHPISTWSRECHGRKHTVSAAWFGEDRLVVATGVEQLSAALDVLDGKAASVGGDHPLGGQIPTGTTVMFRASGIADADVKDDCPIVKQTRSFRFVLGEKEGQSFYRSRSEMTNPEIVSSLKEVIEGAQAMARIHCGENKAGIKLVDALQIKPNGATLTVAWKAPAEEVFVQVDQLCEKIRKHVAKMQERRGHRGWAGKCPMCGKEGKCEKCQRGKKAEKGGERKPQDDDLI